MNNKKARINALGKTIIIDNPDSMTLIDGKDSVTTAFDDVFKKACRISTRWRNKKVI